MKEPFVFLLLALPTISMFAPLSVGQGPPPSASLVYPAAEQIDQIDTYHGVGVPDPYRWMEDMQSQKTLSWIKAEDDLFAGFIRNASARSAIRNRMAELAKNDLFGLPIKANGRYYFTKTDAQTGQSAIYVQDHPSSRRRMLVDPKKLFTGNNARIVRFSPSPDGRWLLLGISREQSRWLDFKIFDVATGASQSEKLAGSHTLGGNVSWSRDSKGFFYTYFERSNDSQLQTPVNSPRILYHALGRSKDSLIFERPENPGLLFSHTVTTDGKYLIITVNEGSSSKSQVLYKELSKDLPVARLIDRADANYTFLGNDGTVFWFFTDLDAQRGRIISINTATPQRDRWSEVVPEAKEAIAGSSTVGGNALGMFGDRFIIIYLKDGSPLLRIFSKRGRLQQEVSLPGGGSLWGGFSGTQNDSEVFYQFLGITHPSSIFRFDAATGQSRLFHQPQLKFNPDSIVVKRVFYRSKDGTRVPMFIAHRKDLTLNGHNPTYMYGYGAFGWVSFIWYQPFVLAWLEMGGIYAQPSIRGGGEYGEAWHQAGMKLKEQNSLDDYLSAAEWLIKNRYTSASKLVANGGSASAPLAAAAIIRRPDLFGAAVIDRPILDLLRFDKFTAAAYWTSEFGSPSNREEFKYLRTYSPYHNLKPGQCYPSTLIMAGDRDQTAVPMHAYKFTAAMQAAQGCGNPVLLKMMWGAGHNFGTSPDQIAGSFADELSFILSVLKIDASAFKPLR